MPALHYSILLLLSLALTLASCEYSKTAGEKESTIAGQEGEERTLEARREAARVDAARSAERSAAARSEAERGEQNATERALQQARQEAARLDKARSERLAAAPNEAERGEQNATERTLQQARQEAARLEAARSAQRLEAARQTVKRKAKADGPGETKSDPPGNYAKQDSGELAALKRFEEGRAGVRQRAWEQTRPPTQPATKDATTDANADAFAAIDEAIQRMEKANIAFNAPKALNRDATVMIHLLLGMSEGTRDLSAQLEGKGEKETAIVPVTHIMQAHLSGPNFQVTPITPEEQPVSRYEKTEWKWNVKPTAVGEQALNLALNAVVTAGGNERKMTVRTFDHVILVEVTAGQQLTDFFSGNWQWLWGAIAIPLVGVAWQKKHKKTNRRGR